MCPISNEMAMVALKKKRREKVNVLDREILLSIVKYTIIAIALVALSGADFFGIRPFGVAFFLALIFLNLHIAILTPMFLVGEVLSGGIFGLFTACVVVLIAVAVKLISGYLKRNEYKTGWLTVVTPLLVAIAPLAFISFTEQAILHILLFGAFSLAFTHASLQALKPVLLEKLRYKMLEIEIICLALLIILTSAGLSSFELWGFPLALAIASYGLFLTAKTAGTTKAVVIALLFGIGHSLIILDVFPLASYAFIAIMAVAFANAPKAIMPLSAICGFLIFRFFFFFDTYGVILWAGAIAGGGLGFMLTPKSTLKTIKNYLFESHDKTAVRFMMQRDRTSLANKLSSASEVFHSMGATLSSLEKPFPNYKNILANKCCALCQHNKRCSVVRERNEALDKMLYAVLIKGKATIEDIPEYLAKNCLDLARLLNACNTVLIKHNEYVAEAKQEKQSRAVVAGQMYGMSSVLSDLASTTKTTSQSDFLRENAIVEELNYASIAVSQSLIADNSVILLLRTETFDRKIIEKVVSTVLHKPYTIVSIDDTLLSGFCSVHLKVRPKADVVFGVAGLAKKAVEGSGDTHSFIKIGTNRFMMALSDGMGCGKKARASSSRAIGLVENFYRAGLSGGLVLKSVNRFLASSNDENFSALDICVIDLDNLQAEIVKLGSPATFIKRRDIVERIDGNALPVGVLDTIEPTSLSIKLHHGDMVVLASDGIEEAFKGDKLSASINNLRTTNPQTLASGILEHALHNSGGKLKDDSTVIVARIILL
ncbi:MAG: SpoIIE family protein phosphatase [Firmicutes bacterium]|nr:SpoIIE family protein phosphatase [Bacillota bacterium]